MVMITLYAKQKQRGCNRSPAKLGCMRQVLGAGALGRPSFKLYLKTNKQKALLKIREHFGKYY